MAKLTRDMEATLEFLSVGLECTYQGRHEKRVIWSRHLLSALQGRGWIASRMMGRTPMFSITDEGREALITSRRA